MAVITPLTLKSTKGMLEMQRLAPEMRKLQQQYRNDRQKLNEETMKLYQEHKVNPMSSCLPLLAQMPVFIIMFRVLHGLTYQPSASSRRSPTPCSTPAARAGRELGFVPRYIAHDSDLFQSLIGQTRDDVVRPRPGQVAGRGARRGLRHGAHLRPARRRCSAGSTSCSSGWSPPAPR